MSCAFFFAEFVFMPSTVNHKAFFLDRDGVINIDHGYVCDVESFEFTPGVFEACQQIVKHGFEIIIVTNQAGIGRGYYTEEQYESLTKWMLEQFAEHQISIKDVRYCPHHATHGQGEYLKDCYSRKPNPGMIEGASKEHNIDLNSSVLVGDKFSDIQAGQRAGIPCLYLIQSKYEPDGGGGNYHQARDLLDAVNQYFN